MKKILKKGGAGIVLKKENYTYDSAFTEFLENSTWSIVNNSTMTSMVLVCNANTGYNSPFASSRSSNFLEPIKSIVIKLMICSNDTKDVFLNLPVELRSRGTKGTGRFSNKILISSDSSVIKEARIQNEICFKSSIDNTTLLNGLAPCVLGMKKIVYDDVFLDQVQKKNYIKEWSDIANSFEYDEKNIDSIKEDETLFLPIKHISELENKMKHNINKNIIKFINNKDQEEFINFLYILNYASFEFPDKELSLCILGMEFIDGFETFASFYENAKYIAKKNAIQTIQLKNEYEFGITQISKIDNAEDSDFSSADYENQVKQNEALNESLYDVYYKNQTRSLLANVSKCVLWSIVSLHSLGYIHKDLHRNNIYVKISNNTNSIELNDVIIIDFGKTKNIRGSQKKFIDSFKMDDNMSLLTSILQPENIRILSKYPFFSQFMLSHIILEFDPSKSTSNFIFYVDLLIILIEYYESIGLKKVGMTPSENVDIMMMSNLITPPDGKNNNLSIITDNQNVRNEFSDFVKSIVEKYKISRPSFLNFENNTVSDSIEYDADESVEMSISNSQSGGKTTIFQKENLISSLPKTKVKNIPTKSLTKNKSKFDVDLLIKQFEERHLQREFQDKNYKIPVWNISKSSLSSKYRKTRKNSKSKSKTKSKTLKGGKYKK